MIFGRQPSRMGVSLLEVLISIGVLAVGLFGVVALIPAASQQAEEGARSDALAIAGKRIAGEFHVRGYASTKSWVPPRRLSFAGATNPLGLFRGGVNGVFTQSPTAPLVAVLNPNLRAVCLDPIGYAMYDQSKGYTDFATTQSDVEIYAFPYTSTNNPAALEVVSHKYLPRLRVERAVASGGSNRGTNSALALEQFRIQDDLEFVLPEKSSESPDPVLAEWATRGVKRSFKGRFSWFATLVPEGAGGTYLASFAVVRSRNAWEPELSASVISFQSFNGTGLLVLESPLEIKPGEWMMILNGRGGEMDVPGTGTTVKHEYKWYQISSKADFVPSMGGHVYSVNGPDWNSDPGIIPARAVVVPHTVAVYSRSIPVQQD